MKIAHITCVYPPYGGGIGKACYHQVKELANFGHKVTVFTPRYDKTTQALEISKVKVNLIKPLFKFRKAAVLFSLIWKLKEFDVVQLHYPFFLTDKIVWLAKKLFNKKFKLVVYYHMDVKNKGWLGKIYQIYNLIWRQRVLKIADLILVSSLDYIQNSQVKDFYFKNKDKFRELAFGVDAEFFKPKFKNQKLLKKYNLKPEDEIILFVGGLDKAHYFKGLPVLFRAIKKLKEDYHRQVKLLIVGGGDLIQKYQQDVINLNLDLNRDIIFTGYIQDRYLPNYYNLSDVFVLPSIDQSEAFGLVLLEAMACAKPCVVSNLPGVRKVIDDYQTGLLSKINDSQDLAQKLEFLLVHNIKRQEMAQQARQLIEKKYNWTRVGYGLIELYQKLLS
jgi:glycosyltransferase involved in cell wall biosynthesis